MSLPYFFLLFVLDKVWISNLACLKLPNLIHRALNPYILHREKALQNLSSLNEYGDVFIPDDL